MNTHKRAVSSNRKLRKKNKLEEKHIKLTRMNILTNEAGFSTVEAYRSARTNIMFSLVNEQRCKNVIITSAMPGDGKTTTCINLAIIFAQAGSNVLVIDADLRRPRVHTYFDLENRCGLSNVLIGEEQLDNVIQKKDGIDFISSGQIPHNPTELLSSKKMEEVMGVLSQKYDYIFYDTPPIALVTDAATFINRTSGCILVARQNYTVHKAVSAAVAALKFANAKILGFILNDAEQENYSYVKKKYGYYGNI